MYIQNRKAIVLFVDFEKAFYSIHRGKMLEIIRKYGVSDKLVQPVKQLYKGTFVGVHSSDGKPINFSNNRNTYKKFTNTLTMSISALSGKNESVWS